MADLIHKALYRLKHPRFKAGVYLQPVHRFAVLRPHRRGRVLDSIPAADPGAGPWADPCDILDHAPSVAYFPEPRLRGEAVPTADNVPLFCRLRAALAGTT